MPPKNADDCKKVNKDLHPKTLKCVNKCTPGKSRNKDFRCIKTKTTTAKKTPSPAKTKPTTTKKATPPAKTKASDPDCEKINKDLHPKTRKCVNKCNPGKSRNKDFRCTKTKTNTVAPTPISNISKVVFPTPAVDDPTITIKETTGMLNLINYYASEGEKYQEEGIQYHNNMVLKNLLYMYLIEKYGSTCFIRANLHGQIYTNTGLVLSGNDDNKLLYKQDIYKQIKLILKCMKRIKSTNKEIIIIPLSIRYKGEMFAHANMLIYRKSLGLIEHFEPHGPNYNGEKGNFYDYINNKVPIILKTIIKKMNTINSDSRLTYYKKNLAYVPPSGVCPYNAGLQRIEEKIVVVDKIKKKEGGFCVLWSFFWAELVLLNPLIPTNNLYKDVLGAISNYDNTKKISEISLKTRNVIRGYLEFLYVQVKPILEKIAPGLDMTTLLSDPYAHKQQQQFNAYLNTQFKKYNDLSYNRWNQNPASKSFSELSL